MSNLVAVTETWCGLYSLARQGTVTIAGREGGREERRKEGEGEGGRKEEREGRREGGREKNLLTVREVKMDERRS